MPIDIKIPPTIIHNVFVYRTNSMVRRRRIFLRIWDVFLPKKHVPESIFGYVFCFETSHNSKKHLRFTICAPLTVSGINLINFEWSFWNPLNSKRHKFRMIFWNPLMYEGGIEIWWYLTIFAFGTKIWCFLTWKHSFFDPLKIVLPCLRGGIEFIPP